MAYATDEDHEFLLSVGFQREDRWNRYVRMDKDRFQYINAVWELPRGQFGTSLDVPNSECVFWAAQLAHVPTDRSLPLRLVVTSAERVTSPRVAYITAEVRGWTPE